MSENVKYRVIDEKFETLEDGTKTRVVYLAVSDEPKKKVVHVVKKSKKGKHERKNGWWARLNERFEEASPLTKTIVTCAAGGAIAAGISMGASAAGNFVRGISEGASGDVAALPAGGEVIEVDPIIT